MPSTDQHKLVEQFTKLRLRFFIGALTHSRPNGGSYKLRKSSRQWGLKKEIRFDWPRLCLKGPGTGGEVPKGFSIWKKALFHGIDFWGSLIRNTSIQVRTQKGIVFHSRHTITQYDAKLTELVRMANTC